VRGTQQAVVLQDTQYAFSNGMPVTARFDLGNNSGIRKRVMVLIHDRDFSDSIVCSFWLEANTPLATYQMRGKTGKNWIAGVMSVYAASADSAGYIRLDNVEMYQVPGLVVNETLCIEPTPPTGSGPDGANLVQNGSFTGSTAPWQFFVNPSPAFAGSRLLNGVFEFYRSPGSVSATVYQNTGVTIPARSIIEARFDLGNSSSARKRVVILLHRGDFTDLQVCAFWLNPGTPLTTFVMQTYNPIQWVNASISIYVSPGDGLGWLRVDNVQMLRRPAINTVGTECLLPGSTFGADAPLETESASQPETAPTTAAPVLPAGELPIIVTPAPFEPQSPVDGGEGQLSEGEG
jgi:hypothetical protein